MKKIIFLLLAILTISLTSCKDDEDDTTIVTGVSLDKTSLSLTTGEEYTLTATVTPTDATDETITWTSSDATKATVANGKVTALAAGTVTITAQVGDKTGTCTVTISPAHIAVTGVSLDKAILSLVTDEEYTLTATITPDNATDNTITWTSSNTSIATVENGKVTAVALGTDTITAKVGDKTATCRVNVMSTVTDIDGNVYHTVQIGTQVWMVENLKTTTYNDGSAISNVTDKDDWRDLTTGAYCDYNNDVANGTKYGHLYNWYAVNTDKLAPTGWHVPSKDEWTTLKEYLIANGYNYDGSITENHIAKSLASSTTDWTTSTNTGAIGMDSTLNNSTGFSALPGGYRTSSGNGSDFNSLGETGFWWSITCSFGGSPRYRYLDYNNAGMYDYSNDKQVGYSVRCVRD